jgi:hypothetical protein
LPAGLPMVYLSVVRLNILSILETGGAGEDVSCCTKERFGGYGQP